jgi:hypothetical protein
MFEPTPEDEQVITIAREIWDSNMVKRIAIRRMGHLYGIDVAVGVAISVGEQIEQQKRFDALIDLIHEIGLFATNEDDHPPNRIGDFQLNIFLEGDFTIMYDDPNLLKFGGKNG